MSRTLPPTVQRAHLEALLIAHAAIDDYYLDACDPARLSPACNILLNVVADHPRSCDMLVVLSERHVWINYACAPDVADRAEFAVRLARRVEKITFADLVDYSRDALVALCNRLPEISRSSGSAAVKRAA